MKQTSYEYKNTAAIAEIEQKYPEMTQAYWNIVHEQYDIFCAKQLNYGPSNISVGTTLQTEEDVQLSLIGLWFRMQDKIQRLKQLVVLGKQDAVGESITDTYQDLSVYGIIAQMVARKKWAK